jgi:hypothetical protein
MMEYKFYNVTMLLTKKIIYLSEEFEICLTRMFIPLQSLLKSVFFTLWWGQCSKPQWLREQTVKDMFIVPQMYTFIQY